MPPCVPTATVNQPHGRRRQHSLTPDGCRDQDAHEFFLQLGTRYEVVAIAAIDMRIPLGRMGSCTLPRRRLVGEPATPLLVHSREIGLVVEDEGGLHHAGDRAPGRLFRIASMFRRHWRVCSWIVSPTRCPFAGSKDPGPRRRRGRWPSPPGCPARPFGASSVLTISFGIARRYRAPDTSSVSATSTPAPVLGRPRRTSKHRRGVGSGSWRRSEPNMYSIPVAPQPGPTARASCI